MGFKKDFIRNIAKFGSYTYIVQVIEFISTIVLSRLISPEEYGFVALIIIFSGFIFVLTNVGIKHAIIRNDYDKDKIKRFFSLSIWIGLTLFVLFAMLAYPIALFYENMKLIFPTMVMGFIFIFESINFVPGSLATKELKFNILGVGSIIQTIFQVILMIILAFLGFSYWSLIIPLTLSPFIKFLYISKKVDFTPALYGFHDAFGLLKEIRTLVGSITISGIFNYWSRNIDNLLIGKFFGDAALGLYNRAYRFIYLATRLVTTVFGVVLFPSLKKLKDEGGDVNKELLTILGGLSLINYPIGFALILLAKPIVLILWGQDWTGVIQFLPYVGILILIQTIFSATGDFYVLQKKEKTVLKLSIISTVLSVSAIVLGVRYSPLHVILFYTLANIIMIPVQVIMGFYRALKFKISELLSFWAPKFFMSILLVYFNFYDHYLALVVIAVFYLAHLLLYLKQDINKFIGLIKEKMAERKMKKNPERI